MKNATRKSGKPASGGRNAPTSRKKAPSARPGPLTGPAASAPVILRKPVAIVGIGASAGGLEALQHLLQALPSNTGMAFVLVQHLEANHPSMLARILANSTQMPIAQVKQRTRAEPNRVYVIPSNADLRIAGGVLQLARRKAPVGKHLPVDTFFQSLAQDQGVRAIGVILSGTASDGTLGTKAIKAEGGITFAQKPETAKFDGMPTNAISAGCVDFVLPPDRIAAELAQISRHPYLRLSRLEESASVLLAPDEEWLRVFSLLKTASGVDFTFYKRSTIKRRIARRMALHNMERVRSYVQYLESNREELDALYQDLLIRVTSFFREPDVFSVLKTEILPRILAGKPPGEPVRIWSAGCSTGEEAYSLAICLLENLGDRAASTRIQIFGTDLSEQAIERARVGIYSVNAVSQLTPKRLRSFFVKIDEQHYQVNANLRNLCAFARHDLTKDPPYSRLDLIVCRNVLIYLEPEYQQKVLASFHYALTDTGVLLLGKSGMPGGHTDLFSLIDRKNKSFSKRAPGRALSYEVARAGFGRLIPQEKRRLEESSTIDLEKEADRIVWEHYKHAGLVVNDDLQVLHFRGDTSPYLWLAPGKATFDLLRLVGEELAFELRGAIHKARRSGTAVRLEAIRIKHNGSFRDVNVVVRPLPGPSNREKYFLLLFEEARPHEERQAVGHKRERTESRELRKLATQLARTREYLQTLSREQESTSRELKTANEEAISGREELQSANEELETAKEELQSSNEQLLSSNEKLQNRNAELLKSQEELRDMAGRLLSMQEADTRLLARELHDDLSQRLVALSMEASTLSKSSPESPDLISGRIRDLGQKIGAMAAEVHQISRQLHPAILDDLGVEAALREECTSFSRRLGIPVRFKAKEVPRSLPGDIALCLFRVAQESLRNIGKHANAKEVRVLLTCRKADLALFIEDIGDGFDLEQARKKGGLGLISMEERVRLLNGDFKIRSQPGEGTEVEVHMPLPEKAS